MTSQSLGYVYIWEYTVLPERVVDFERAYGPDGAWVALFKRANGYIRTELYQDRHISNRYLTIDCWESKEAWQAFRTVLSAEFEAIDAQCEGFTLEEREIGQLTPVEQ
jgi:quinol monooxygenase YgiN